MYVEEAYRREGIGLSLVAYCMNRQKEWGYIPYGHTFVENQKSLALQEKMGLYVAKDTIWWLQKRPQKQE